MPVQEVSHLLCLVVLNRSHDDHGRLVEFCPLLGRYVPVSSGHMVFANVAELVSGFTNKDGIAERALPVFKFAGLLA